MRRSRRRFKECTVCGYSLMFPNIRESPSSEYAVKYVIYVPTKKRHFNTFN